MSKILSSIILSLAVVASITLYAGSKAKDNIPAWLQKSIEARGTSGSLSASISAYKFRGELVYFVPAATCCDLMSTVYSESGQVLCHPDGGFTGLGDSRCSGFSKEASYLKTVWSARQTESKKPVSAE